MGKRGQASKVDTERTRERERERLGRSGGRSKTDKFLPRPRSASCANELLFQKKPRPSLPSALKNKISPHFQTEPILLNRFSISSFQTRFPRVSNALHVISLSLSLSVQESASHAGREWVLLIFLSLLSDKGRRTQERVLRSM